MQPNANYLLPVPQREARGQPSVRYSPNGVLRGLRLNYPAYPIARMFPPGYVYALTYAH